MTLFRKKKSSSKLRTSAEPSPSVLSLPSSLVRRRSSAASATPLSLAPAGGLPLPQIHVDDFGRPADLPAFSNQTGAFGSAYGVGDDSLAVDPQAELQLLYGYAPLSTTLELGVAKVEDIVSKCAVQIRQRGLDTPLIMSSMALDITVDGVCSLIRSYLADVRTWEYDLQLVAPLSVGAMMKWALGRLINDRGGRGFVSWDSYNDFKAAEKATGYKPKSCTIHLIARLPMSNGRLLATLLSLFSSVSAHSGANGMPPRKLAALFSPYVFGLADDQTFDATYEEWQRATDATEHIILSYIRDQQADGPLPTFLEKFVYAYPSTLNISYSNAAPKLPKGGRVEEVTRVRRLTRFHSRNLIASAGTWDVPHSADWQLFFGAPSASASSSTPLYTPHYRHLLNIRSMHGLEDLDDEGEMQRYKTVVEKEWSKFGEIGFQDVDSKKLEFDLTEGERNPVKQKHETMDWSTFETSGFAGRELFAPTDLVFQQSLKQRVNTWPSAAKTLDDRLRATEKLLPSFPYDTTPHEEPRLLVDVLFFEAWADVLVGGGWARDELKESSFALIQWKSRPREGELSRGRVVGNDQRTEDRWVLVEEFVPREYRDALTDPKVTKPPKRISFMRTVRRKTSSKAPTSPSSPYPPPVAPPKQSGISSASYNSSGTVLRPIDESVFSIRNDQTKLMTLSNALLRRNSYARSAITSYAPSGYAPSIVSTVRANDGHANYSSLDLPGSRPDDASFRGPSPPPAPLPGSSSMSFGVGGMFRSQTRGLAVNGNDGIDAACAPVGYQKPAKKGFLARIGTKNKKASENSGAGLSSPMAPLTAGASVESVGGTMVASSGRTTPTQAAQRYSNDAVAGIPPLAPVAEGPRASASEDAMIPPVPPKDETSPAAPVPGASATATATTRSSSGLTTIAAAPATAPATATADPYGGMDGPVAMTRSSSGLTTIAPATATATADPCGGMDDSAVTTHSSSGRTTIVPAAATTDRYGGMDDSSAPAHSSSELTTIAAAPADPYGGIDDPEVDEAGVQGGTVLSRGSQSFPEGLGEVAEGKGELGDEASPGGVNVSSPPRRIPAPVATQRNPPPRHDSLPDSPKPDAEVPIDELDPRFPDVADKYRSGASQVSSRVANIIGLYERRLSGVPGEDVRLTQYGFGPEAAGQH
ncbi:hypothetical protein JCM1841_002760 [Sporobolomyces salmonicolor]